MKQLLDTPEDFKRWRESIYASHVDPKKHNVLDQEPMKFPCVAVWHVWVTWDSKDILEFNYVYHDDFVE